MIKTGSSSGGRHPSSKYMAITWKSFSNRASNCVPWAKSSTKDLTYWHCLDDEQWQYATADGLER